MEEGMDRLSTKRKRGRMSREIPCYSPIGCGTRFHQAGSDAARRCVQAAAKSAKRMGELKGPMLPPMSQEAEEWIHGSEARANIAKARREGVSFGRYKISQEVRFSKEDLNDVLAGKPDAALDRVLLNTTGEEAQTHDLTEIAWESLRADGDQRDLEDLASSDYSLHQSVRELASGKVQRKHALRELMRRESGDPHDVYFELSSSIRSGIIHAASKAQEAGGKVAEEDLDGAARMIFEDHFSRLYKGEDPEKRIAELRKRIAGAIERGVQAYEESGFTRAPRPWKVQTRLSWTAEDLSTFVPLPASASIARVPSPTLSISGYGDPIHIPLNTPEARVEIDRIAGKLVRVAGN